MYALAGLDNTKLADGAAATRPHHWWRRSPRSRRRRLVPPRRSRPCSSLAPGTAETVVDDDGDVDPGPRRRARGAAPRRSASGSSGNRSDALSAVRWPHIRLVHPGVRHDEAEPVLDDQNAAARPHDANRLRQDDLDEPRVLVDFRRERRAPWRRARRSRGRRCAPRPSRRSSARRQARRSRARRDAVALERRGDQFDQVVARLDQGQALRAR